MSEPVLAEETQPQTVESETAAPEVESEPEASAGEPEDTPRRKRRYRRRSARRSHREALVLAWYLAVTALGIAAYLAFEIVAR